MLAVDACESSVRATETPPPTVASLPTAIPSLVDNQSSPTPIHFTIFEAGYSLNAPMGTLDQEPFLIILASQKDMMLPSGYTFAQPLLDRLKEIDFSKSFLIRVLRGHPDRGLVKEVVRKKDDIIITTYDVVVGPGNYATRGQTQPYEFIKIDKGDRWGKQLRFVLQRETQGVLAIMLHDVE